MNTTEDFQTRYQRYQQALAQANSLNKTAVFDVLAAAGITEVAVTFNGEGDSGQIEDIVAHKGEHPYALPNVSVEIQQISWGSEKLDSRKMALREAIDHLCYDVLAQEHEGWENNDGACGDFAFVVDDRRIELDFNARFTDSIHFSHSF
jgi:hypothetical protein